MKENLVLMKKSTLMQKGSIKIVHVKDRERVAKGQPIFSIAADKANYQLESPKDGYVKLLCNEGSTVSVGTLIAYVCDEAHELDAVQEAVGPAVPSASPAPLPEVAPAPQGEPQGEELSGVKRAMFEQMERAHVYVPATTFMEVDMNGVRRARETNKYSYTTYSAHAVVQALKDFPGLNVSYLDGRLVRHASIHLGIALSGGDKLYVPVVRGADALDKAQLESRVREFQQKGKEDRFAAEDFEGGTFTVTNSGIFGSYFFAPVINYPQSAILGIGAIVDRPVAVSGQVVIHPMMILSLSYDHRLIEGSLAVTFLARVKSLLEGA